LGEARQHVGTGNGPVPADCWSMRSAAVLAAIFRAPAERTGGSARLPTLDHRIAHKSRPILLGGVGAVQPGIAADGLRPPAEFRYRWTKRAGARGLGITAIDSHVFSGSAAASRRCANYEAEGRRGQFIHRGGWHTYPRDSACCLGLGLVARIDAPPRLVCPSAISLIPGPATEAFVAPDSEPAA
jgi:hypothetical protein